MHSIVPDEYSYGSMALGGEVAVFLNIGLFCLVCCCTYLEAVMEGANMSTQVASQTNNLPRNHSDSIGTLTVCKLTICTIKTSGL